MGTHLICNIGTSLDFRISFGLYRKSMSGGPLPWNFVSPWARAGHITRINQQNYDRKRRMRKFRYNLNDFSSQENKTVHTYRRTGHVIHISDVNDTGVPYVTQYPDAKHLYRRLYSKPISLLLYTLRICLSCFCIIMVLLMVPFIQTRKLLAIGLLGSANNKPFSLACFLHLSLFLSVSAPVSVYVSASVCVSVSFSISQFLFEYPQLLHAAETWQHDMKSHIGPKT